MHELEQVNVLGVGVHAVNMRSVASMLGARIRSGGKGFVCLTGVHGIMEAQKYPEFKAILNGSLLTTPDGVPTVWVGRWQGYSQMQRVFGPELMLEVCAMSVGKGYTHFLYGGADGVAEQLKASLLRRFPGLRIVGTYTPPFRPLNQAEKQDLYARVSTVKPDIFWVGLSTPKQEHFMARYLPLLDTRVMIGVGAAFLFHTGVIQDSPQWVKNVGLQWLHRLLQEPARLWRRYLLNNPRFICFALLQLVGIKRYALIHDQIASPSAMDLR